MSDGVSTATGWALLPLRLFLGFTFVYAGFQKLADPTFFDSSNPGSIQAQLRSAAPGSPLGPLLRIAEHIPVPVGVVIALAEIAIGIGTVLGFRIRIAAIGGMIVSLVFFLTNSWQDRPYYLGSDIVFLFAWTPFALIGAGSVWALDAALERRGVPGGPDATHPADEPVGRRAFLSRVSATGVLAVAGLAAAGFAAAFGRLAGSHSNDAIQSSGTPPTTAQNPVIRDAGAIAVGTAVGFTDPVTGDPAFLVRPESTLYVAFDAVCPHAGCHVAYSSGVAEFVCPCHGSRFNGRTGAVISGPATRGLTEIPVSVAPDGSVSAS